MAAHLVLPWTHHVFVSLKRWALGTYHGLRRQHLQAAPWPRAGPRPDPGFDEFTFRFNRRHDRPAAFHRLLGLATTMPPTTYHMLVTRS